MLRWHNCCFNRKCQKYTFIIVTAFIACFIIRYDDTCAVRAESRKVLHNVHVNIITFLGSSLKQSFVFCERFLLLRYIYNILIFNWKWNFERISRHTHEDTLTFDYVSYKCIEESIQSRNVTRCWTRARLCVCLKMLLWLAWWRFVSHVSRIWARWNPINRFLLHARGNISKLCATM